MFFIGMSETSDPGYRRWLTETSRRVWFTPRVLQDVEIETSDHQIGRSGIGYRRLMVWRNHLM